jgi:hypothetical protein
MGSMTSRAALMLATLLLPACAGRAASPVEPPAPPSISSVAVEGERLAEATLTALRAIEATVRSGDDPAARAMIVRLRQRTTEERVLDLLDGFERVLEGRRRIAQLDLALDSVPEPEEPGLFRLRLLVTTRADEPATLRLPPGSLRRLLIGIDPEGLESRLLDSYTAEGLEEVLVEPGETTVVDLNVYSIPQGRALCVRERWELELRSGEFEQAGVSYPAAPPPVAPCERVQRAAFLPTDAVDPAELLAYLEREEDPYLPALLERAVRIATGRRDEALELLAPAVARLAEERPERVVAAAPALRWLTRSRDPGADPAEWADWLAEWQEHRAPRAPRPELEVPDGPRTTEDGV